MQNLSLFIVGWFLTLAASSTIADTFEGRYDMEFSGDGETVAVAFWVKDGHMRMKVADFGGQMGEMIVRDGMSSMIMVMPQQRIYMEMPFPKGAFEDAVRDADVDDLPFKKTGNEKEILGMRAHEFLYEEGGEKMTIWATDELGSMPFARNPMLQGWANAMSRLTGLKSFFPLETTGTENGKEAYRMTVTKVEKQSLADSMFLPPDGFMKMTLPAGMGGLIPGMPGG